MKRDAQAASAILERLPTLHEFIPSRRRGFCLMFIAGAAVFAVGVVADRNWPSDARFVGGALFVAGLARWSVRPIFISLRDLYASAHQQGYDQGWSEGRRTERPVLLHLDDYRSEPVQADIAAGPR